MAERDVLFVASVQMVTELCCNCGVMFAMTRDFNVARRADRKNFFCPAGHPQHYTGKTEEDKLREEVERQRQMREAEAARTAKVVAERDAVAKAHNRMRKRVMNGVCPCCNRTFQNLLQHMKNEHAGEFSLRDVREAFGMTQSQVAHEAGVQQAYVSWAERGRPVPGWAKNALDSWVDRNAGRAAMKESHHG